VTHAIYRRSVSRRAVLFLVGAAVAEMALTVCGGPKSDTPVKSY